MLVVLWRCCFRTKGIVDFFLKLPAGRKFMLSISSRPLARRRVSFLGGTASSLNSSSSRLRRDAMFSTSSLVKKITNYKIVILIGLFTNVIVISIMIVNEISGK